MDLIEAIQAKVDKIAEEKYKEEDLNCTPVFIVSLLINDKIILTCKHNNISFSEIIFPIDKVDIDNWLYGLLDLEDHMQDLYNRTM
ncbi:MAG: hypothetical protein ACRDB0_08385 [Paraclostridium sp.]